jgi:hypothetical protein
MWFIFLDFFPTRFLIVGCSYVNACKFQKYIGIDHNLASLWGKVIELMFLHLQENTIVVNLAVALEKEGISAFRFDFAGNG